MTPKAENKVQQEIYVYFNNKYCLPIHQPREIILHIPNEGKGNGKLISVGLRPGAADLILTFKGRFLWIECKEEKGTQSDNQKRFQKHIEQLGAPHEYHVVRTLEQFKSIIYA